MATTTNGVITNLYETTALTLEGIIHDCTKIIERNETVAGAGKRILNPMLSIFLGKHAVEHINEIQEAYYSCWSDHAKNLKILQGAYSKKNIEDAIFQSTQTEDRSMNATAVRTVWFWDIMDDDFDTYFECVKEPYSMPVATANKRVYFVFCSQRDSDSQEKTRIRLQEKLIPWAQEHNYPLVVLSDATSKGVLRPSGVAENYRLAASLTLIMNSYYATNEEDLGRDMTFALENNPVFTASYHGCTKNFFDIVGISLLTIIKRYRSLGQNKSEDYSYGNSVQDRLCGTGRDYYNLIDDIFDETLGAICKADARLWGDLPAIDAVNALRRQMQGGAQKGGFFSRLLGGGNSSQVTVQDVIAQYGDFFKCCLERYYTAPVTEYLNSEIGQRTVKDYMYSRMTSVLNYDEMHTLLARESHLVETLCDDVNSKMPPLVTEQFRTPEELLHAYAQREVKLHVAKLLLSWLSEAMATLCRNAAGFDDLLRKVQNSLPEEHLDHSVIRAYGSHMEQLLDSNKTLLTRHIRPSEHEQELLLQLKDTFIDLINADNSRVYYQSLQDDLQFRIENGGSAAAINVIENCFKYDMSGAARLPTLRPPQGTLYCIMNNAMDNLGSAEDGAIGKRFIVSRSDRIERLALFKIDPEFIMYTNSL